MAAHGKKKRHDDHGEHPDERWLVTYADLMTLLVALFMVLFSISSVNKSKFESIQRSLQDAFSGRILPGGKSIKDAGGSANIVNPSVAAPRSSLEPYVGGRPKNASSTGGAAKEQKDFQKVKAQIDAYVAKKGLSGKVKTEITDDGLLIRLLTDNLLFDSGSAVPRAGSDGLLTELAGTLAAEGDHQLVVSGNTDTVPIHSGRYTDNLDLSTARAGAVVRIFAQHGVSPARMTAAGRGQYNPVAPNTTAGGRSLNRRVEILVPRTAAAATSSSSAGATTIPSIKPDLTPTKP
ncbi:OmpA family protein [Baekduia soli]|uniref:OmpA family protein n=1 Tax=Baekduia soli TaxID=496014 RepID=A0A5B8U1K7_9ACTN|nr:flagellar motor protein MotB [Baekduia soli]QEC46857.1 OmpA family protein [Baekduia soli]